jgi:hypothetical protein
MPSRRLFTAAGFAVILLVLFNFLVGCLARHTQRGRLLTALDHLPPSTQCVFLGNSLVEAGCDPVAFTDAWNERGDSLAAVNLALGATSPVEHYLILKRALRAPVHPKYLVYGFSDDQLTVPVSGAWADLVGNRAFSYCFPAEAARFYAPHSSLARWRMFLIAHIPMLAERSSLWAKVERLRRHLEAIGLPEQKINRYGRVADFKALEPADAASFTTRCCGILERRQGFSSPVQAILSLARQNGVQVFLVEMPMSPEHQGTFYSLPAWKRLRAYLESLAAQQGAGYVAAGDWVPDAGDFEDTVHLNERGARLFSARLAATLSGVEANLSVHK